MHLRLLNLYSYSYNKHDNVENYMQLLGNSFYKHLSSELV